MNFSIKNTVFTPVHIKFCIPQMWCLFEGGIYLKKKKGCDKKIVKTSWFWLYQDQGTYCGGWGRWSLSTFLFQLWHFFEGDAKSGAAPFRVCMVTKNTVPVKDQERKTWYFTFFAKARSLSSCGKDLNNVRNLKKSPEVLLTNGTH